MIEIYIDGSSRGSQQNRSGGFGMVVFEDEEIVQATSSQYKNVTNNEMELNGLLCALDYIDIHYPKDKINIYCDSTYVVNSYNEWISNWARNGWIGANKQPIANRGLMEEIYSYISRPFFKQRVKLIHCDGHSGILGNELADLLATNNIDKYIRESQSAGYETKTLDELDFS